MSKFEKMSVIMPVHNAVNYVREAISSILNQSLHEFQLIIIDDGSSDGSENICDEYARQDKRIEVYHYKNLGISKARNIGLQFVRGEYICFCDHDDVYKDNLLEENYELAKKFNVDIVKFGVECIQVFRDGTCRNVPSYNTISCEGKFDICKSESSFFNYYYCSNLVWNGIYRSSIIKDNCLQFPEAMKFGCEDGYFCMELFQCSHSIYYNKKNYYTHFSRENQSTSFKFDKNKIFSQLTLWKKRQDIIETLELLPGSVLYEECMADILIQLQSLLVHCDCDLNRWQRNFFLDMFRMETKEISSKALVLLVRKNRKKGITLLLFTMRWYYVGLKLKKLKEILNRKRLA